MLSNYMVDNGHMGAIVEGDALLAVVYIEIVGNNVLARDKTVAVALNSDVANDVVVVLIAREDESRGVAGIVQKLLAEDGIADVF